jgi:hypothetical protein
MTNFLFVKDNRLRARFTMRPSFAASRTSGRGGWERASVAACSKRTARFDEDISIFLLVKSPDWRRRNDTSHRAANRRAFD